VDGKGDVTGSLAVVLVLQWVVPSGQSTQHGYYECCWVGLGWMQS